ncbi:3'-5' exonuclease [Porticoccaceae bacterium]|jgi:DNA polymerase III epsilon subunit-like protein|nr:3'-5' exonuclease [Porticoccaceae bacterium]MDB4755141.1 3'-5' exonuclease [Akkermansiaceae bacterium]
MDESLLRFDKKQKYLVFDTETEGLNLIRSRPWQVAWLVVEGGKILEKHDMFLDWPNLDVSAGAAKITGFTMEEYNKRKESPRKVWEKFSKHLYDEDTFIVGQNLLGFDVYMVNIWRELMKLEADYSYVERIIDTRALAVAIAKDIPVDKDDFISWQYRLINHRERKLKTSQAFLLKKYNIDHDPKRLHDALYDIEMNFKVFRKQLFDLEI